MISIPIILKEPSKLIRENEPVRLGVPFPKGMLYTSSSLQLIDDNEQQLPLAICNTALWPDKSIKWALIDFQACLKQNETKTLILTDNSNAPPCQTTTVKVENTDNQIFINTGKAQFIIGKHHLTPFDKVTINNKVNVQPGQIILTGQDGSTYQPVISEVIEDKRNNQLRATLTIKGKFVSQNSKILANFSSSLSFFSNSAAVEWNFTLHNPCAAEHPNGIWDLGDAGSIFFKSLVIKFPLPSSTSTLWKSNQKMPWKEDRSKQLSIYQESSGGENWNGNIHKNYQGNIQHTLKGYRCQDASGDIEQDLRANPIMHIKHEQGAITAYIDKFWQNFPKAIEVNNSELSLHLFPEEYPDIFELQGGESKTHNLYLDFSGNQDTLDWSGSKIIAQLPLNWYAQSAAFPYFSDKNHDTDIDDIINEGITGTNNYFKKREIIDEFGWRNFGEIYADHETLGHKGEQPLVSHYNNQYDSLYGFARQYITTGDYHWFELMEDLARHITDIDIYNTKNDRAEYNGGLFWHTDHYLDAFTCTHRTYSKWQITDEEAGGGPGTEHCYTTGLLYHYFLTGSEPSKEAVLTLREWIENLHEGTGTLLERLLAIKNQDIPALKAALSGNKTLNFKYPLTRGTGNYVTTLLDAYSLTSERRHIELAERVITQTIHPLESLADRNLENIEITWSYTIFLQALVKYLNLKETMDEYDNSFFYAKDALLNFADWMLEHEYPFLEKPEILEYPNHTWVAQDIRKANLLYFAYQYSDNVQKRNAYFEKAQFFHKYVATNLAEHETRSFSRILAILMQNQGPHTYFMQKIAIKDYQKTDSITYDEIKTTSAGAILRTILIDLLKRLGALSISNEIRWIQNRSKLFARFSKQNK